MTRLAWALALMLASAHALSSPLTASRAGNMQTALDDLSLALLNHGYTLVKVQPVDQALVKRGFADPGIRLAFIGKEEQVRQALASDPALLNLLPMRLSLASDNGRVRVSSDDLALWRDTLPSAGAVLQQWEDDLSAMLADYAAE
jgi:uncharacterized protein (DUF302 family)